MNIIHCISVCVYFLPTWIICICGKKKALFLLPFGFFWLGLWKLYSQMMESPFLLTVQTKKYSWGRIEGIKGFHCRSLVFSPSPTRNSHVGIADIRFQIQVKVRPKATVEEANCSPFRGGKIKPHWQELDLSFRNTYQKILQLYCPL